MTDPAADDLLILVDSNDNAIGTSTKLDAHKRGLKHRAISALVKNSSGEFLLHRRHAAKYHSGGLWTNACCSHPMPGEETAAAAHRRLQEELGFDTDLTHQFHFIYKVQFDNGLTEHEFDHVFVGYHDGNIAPNSLEVKDYCFMKFCDKEILNDSDFDYNVYYKEVDEIVYTENPMKRK